MYLPKASIEAIVEAVDGLRPGADDLLLVFLGEKNVPDLERLVSALRLKNVRFMGGVFPGLIHGARHHLEGAILLSLPARTGPFVIAGLDRETVKLPESLGLEGATNGNPRCTAVVLADGLAPDISSLLSELFGVMGNTVNYLGGGAGFSDLKQRPCVFTSEGVFQNAAVLAFVALDGALGVRHGWKKLVGPIVATKTRKNVLIELNWRSALEGYREIVEGDSGRKLTHDNFAAIASSYPFGIYKEGAEDVVRDPIAVTDSGHLVCVGEIPENTVLNILKGRSEWLVTAAGQAAGDCLAAQGRNIRQALVVDCVSRSLFLRDGFEKELETVAQRVQALEPGLVPEGMLSLGEISSSGQGFLEFFNKTIVVGILYHA